ncbi:cell wall hydrolase [Phenylobacterium terrae]|uniref:Cell wall hydrolase n=1 Tax=Phenylobacterium terrae TaxID=2665495 RepID=A0ABW4N2M3_9CAUL
MASPRLHIGVRSVFASALAAVALLGCMTSREEARRADPPRITDLSEQGLARYTAGMDPAMLTLARRHDPASKPDLWGRPEGWASLDLAEAPDLGFFTAQDATAEQLNDLLPFSDGPIHPMRPFVLKASGQDRERALKCLTEAVYYEAAREPIEGQRAVAQTVINRLRHPEYPKSVCGVVYQGSARTTGCQFSFTCDGSLRWAPEPALWARARKVAEAALNGYVAQEVGPATHYHADYVAPYWAPTLAKLTKIGAHIFYRWTGPAGQPAAFTGRYAGGEARLTPAILGGIDRRTQGLIAPEAQGIPAGRTVALSVGGEVRTYKVADATAAGGERTRVIGTLTPARRKPTADEVRKINESLAALEAPKPAAAAAPDNATPAAAAPETAAAAP